MLRESAGYTRETFANAIGIGTAQVARYERGENDATGEVLSRIAQLFGVTTDYLLGLSDAPEASVSDKLSVKERMAISAWRRGERLEAMKVIANDDDIVSAGK